MAKGADSLQHPVCLSGKGADALQHLVCLGKGAGSGLLQSAVSIQLLAVLGGQALARAWSLDGAEGTWRQGLRMDEILCGSM